MLTLFRQSPERWVSELWRINTLNEADNKHLFLPFVTSLKVTGHWKFFILLYTCKLTLSNHPIVQAASLWVTSATIPSFLVLPSFGLESPTFLPNLYLSFRFCRRITTHVTRVHICIYNYISVPASIVTYWNFVTVWLILRHQIILCALNTHSILRLIEMFSFRCNIARVREHNSLNGVQWHDVMP